MRTPEKQIGLLWGVPTIGRPLNTDWANSLKALGPPPNYTTHYGTIWGREVADARNQFALDCLKRNCRLLFFLGDDVTAPPYGLKQLIYRMEHDEAIGVVAGFYCTKANPPFPLIFRGNGAGSYWDWRLGEFFEVSGIGMDFTLIRREVLEDLEPEWEEKFQAGEGIFPRRKQANEWFQTIDDDEYLDAIPSAESWTEDLYFCNRVIEETDWKIYVDTSVMCTHWEYIHPNRWRPWRLRPDSKPMRRPTKDPSEKLALNIGAGGKTPDLGMARVITLDIREDTDPDYRSDARTLPFEADTFDLVYSSHVLEHFNRRDVPGVLDEWLRVLRINGEIMLIVPTIEWAAKKILAGEIDEHVGNVLWGDQTHRHNYHKSGFTAAILRELLEDRDVEILDTYDETDGGYNLVIRGRKG